ncbi:MAG: hypothetical protein K5840_04325, partial [Eubacterium sp.]|nr:hypothetical protein [Eubacterium sp.]
MTSAERIEKYTEGLKHLGSKPGLEAVTSLSDRVSDAVGAPGRLCDLTPCVQISGTNGKGSTARFLGELLQDAGLKVGTFSSPSVFEYREMWRIGDDSIGDDELWDILSTVESACAAMVEEEGYHPTLFEVETVAAFLYFYKEECDIAIYEAGMGGLLDATNIIAAPLVSVITPVGVEHRSFLGDTIEEIATHKAGIIKPGCIAVSAPQEASVGAVIRARADNVSAGTVQVDITQSAAGEGTKTTPVDEAMHDVVSVEVTQDASDEAMHTSFTYGGRRYEIDSPARYQVINAATAIAAFGALKEKLGAESFRELGDRPGAKPDCNPGRSPEYVFTFKAPPGRLERLGILPRGAALYIDGAHNPPAAK